MEEICQLDTLVEVARGGNWLQLNTKFRRLQGQPGWCEANSFCLLPGIEPQQRGLPAECFQTPNEALEAILSIAMTKQKADCRMV
jgi:hypothetical protein